MSAVAAGLLAVLCLAGCVAWAWWLWRWKSQSTGWRVATTPIATWHPLLAAGVLALVGLQVANRMEAARRGSPAEVTIESLQVAVVTQATIGLLILAGLQAQSPGNSLRDYGFRIDGLLRQVGEGLLGYALAVPPVTLLLVATSPFRSSETQHALLQWARTEDGHAAMVWIVVTAVVIAPLFEELLFRVALQGWLESRFGPWIAIGASSILFAVVHGWRDAIPLLPLAVVLGTLYHLRRSYAANVVTHAVFNAVFLGMTMLPAEP